MGAGQGNGVTVSGSLTTVGPGQEMVANLSVSGPNLLLHICREPEERLTSTSYHDFLLWGHFFDEKLSFF